MIVFSYLSSIELCTKINVLNKETRRHLLRRQSGAITVPANSRSYFPERTLKLVLKDDNNSELPFPAYLMDFADRLIIQSVHSFK